jgi:protein O-GlcNAc transferase
MALSSDDSFEQAIVSFQAGRLHDAERHFKEVLRHQPKHVAALNLLSVVLTHSKRYAEAEPFIKRALEVNANSDATFYNYGLILKALNRPHEALERFNQALSINANVAETWNNRGTIFNDLKRYDDAIADFNKAIAFQQNYAEAFYNKGKSLAELNRYDEAFAAFDKALALKPDLAEAWVGRGNAFNELKRYEEAFIAYDKAFGLEPDLTGVEGARLHAKMHLCHWINFNAECKRLISSVRNRNANTPPFPFLAIPSSPEDQLQCARLWVAETFSPSQNVIWRGERYNHDRIRLAYLSADFHQHAISYLTAGLFDCHDKSRFEVTAVSLGTDDNSEMRQRLKSSFEHFIDAETFSDDQIANLVRSSEADIVVDLMGFTEKSRTGIFARRPAPTQVNYLGYPGTMGAEYIDYIIADEIVIPENQREFYSEKIVLLPNSYQANDAKRSIVDRAFTRGELGLPLTGFVFCCFNNAFKITPHVFDSWMRIMKQVDGSVLWLISDNVTASHNLKQEAAARGVNPERLVFANRMSPPDHLARHRLAGLFLDTLPYNAHTTASDALWAGLPVLTLLGKPFAGRVAASLLNSAGLPELITTTPEAYEQMAVDLATHPEKMASIKHKLAVNRLTTPLFDTGLFTKHIEAAYTAMYERHRAGLLPDHIVVPD